MTVSLLTCDLGIVLEIAGGLSATALAFIVRCPVDSRSARELMSVPRFRVLCLDQGKVVF